MSGHPSARTGGILVVASDLRVGGTERHLAQVLPVLAAAGLPIHLALLDPDRTLAPAFERAGIALSFPGRIASRLPRPLRLALALPRLALLMARQPPAVLHAFLPLPTIVAGALGLLFRVPVRIASRRGTNWYHRRHRAVGLAERLLHRATTLLLPNSMALARELVAEGADPDRVRVLYNGVDAARFAPGERRDAMRAALGFGADALVVACVANLRSYKGHADLIDAMAAIAPKLPAAWCLLCVGRDDGLGPALRARAEAAGISAQVRFLGASDEVAAILAAADLGVLAPTDNEGFSNAILEMMAAGLPVVATDVGGNAEAVLHGQTGLIVPPGDAAALGHALLSLAGMHGARRSIGAAGRERAARNFALADCLASYARLYAAALRGREALLRAAASLPAPPPPPR